MCFSNTFFKSEISIPEIGKKDCESILKLQLQQTNFIWKISLLIKKSDDLENKVYFGNLGKELCKASIRGRGSMSPFFVSLSQRWKNGRWNNMCIKIL